MVKYMDKENILILMGMYKKVHLKMTYTSLILRRVKNKYFLPCVILKKKISKAYFLLRISYLIIQHIIHYIHTPSSTHTLSLLFLPPRFIHNLLFLFFGFCKSGNSLFLSLFFKITSKSLP